MAQRYDTYLANTSSQNLVYEKIVESLSFGEKREGFFFTFKKGLPIKLLKN